MLGSHIAPGQRIEIMFKAKNKMQDEDEGGRPKSYVSQISEVIDDRRVEIFMPMEKTKMVLLQEGVAYNIFFYTKKGVYLGEATVVRRYKKGNIYLVEIIMETVPQKHQRREFYRLPFHTTIESRLLSQEETEKVMQQKGYVLEELPMDVGASVDISGGGLKYINEETYPVGKIVYHVFEIPVMGKMRKIEVFGKILYERPAENDRGKFEHRIQFFAIRQGVREQIIHFIFDEERKNRKKDSGI